MADSEAPSIGDETLAAAVVQHFPKHLCQAHCIAPSPALTERLRDAGIREADMAECDTAIIIDRGAAPPGGLTAVTREAIQSADPRIMVCLVVDSQSHGDELGASFAGHESFAQSCDAIVYRAQAIGAPAAATDANPLASAPAAILWLVRAGYDPAAHAQELLAADKPNEALALITSVPVDYMNDIHIRRAVAHARHDALARIMPSVEEHERWYLFGQAQRYFFYDAHADPETAEHYVRHAERWALAGHGEMARRIEASTRHALDTPPVQYDIAVARHEPAAYGQWSGDYRPRILLIAHNGNDYGVDTLYDGLCTLLGSDHVVEFPHKPGLHGEMNHIQCPYPCLFDHPANGQSIRELADELLAGKFDLVVYADPVGYTNTLAVQALAKAATGIPFVVYDAGDEFQDLQHEMTSRAGAATCLAYFKREMMTNIDYGANAWPLPFGYPQSYLPEKIDGERDADLFWAGTPVFGMRPLYIHYLEKALRRSLRPSYSQAEYTHALLGARVGLSLFGWGFDTVRYWEIAAHGAMLLAERPPIHIPNNFEDGHSAIYFDDLEALEEMLTYYFAHPEESAGIAARGHAQLIQHHTTKTRAAQFLGSVEAQLRRSGQ